MLHSERPQHAPTAFRRHVFYISGFDPRGALFIHNNCLNGTEKWSRLTGHRVETGERYGIGEIADAWTVEADLPDGRVETEFQCLRWDDIIRRNWDKKRWRVALRVFLLIFLITPTGAFKRAWRESWPFAVTMSTSTLPVIVPLGCALLTLVGLSFLLFNSAWPVALLGVPPLLAAAWLALWGWRNMAGFQPEWTGRTGLYAWKLAHGEVPRIHERLDEMVEHIIETIEREEPDEALVIGHSFGTILAVLVAARILKRRPELGARGSKLSLVTLGPIHCFVADIPRAGWFRDEIAGIAGFPDFNWLEFSSPPDGACYALVSALDFLPEPRPKNLPRLLNAQFHKTFSPERMAEARADRMIMHFLYLQAPDHPQPDTDLYDFVMLIAGPVPAGRRFAGRASGKAFYRKVAA